MMRLAVDAWAPGFSPATGGDDDLEASDGNVDVNCELAAGDWAPQRPPPDVAPVGDVRFVDGVRRIDARVWVTEGGDTTSPTTRPAIAVSYGAGTVRSNHHAVIEDCRIRRELFGPAGIPALATSTVRYTPVAVPASDDEHLIAAVQDRMGRLEIASVSAADPAEMTIVDGSLFGRQHVPGALGYVKTHHVAYLPPVVGGVVAALAAGERTPVFVTQTSWARFSWYLRLPYAAGHPWAGVVRLEATTDLTIAQVVRLADQTAATLPRFANQPHRDPRAPQNLLPIAGLEAALKRRLGDAGLMERHLRVAAART